MAWHSGLRSVERRRAWHAIASGEAKIVVGARSALFLPYADLGVIVVDEAHETSFKQEDGVHYHARDVAVTVSYTHLDVYKSPLVHWFVPTPWTVTACEMDLRPGGVVSTTMRSPEGEEFPNSGCYLEVVPGERLIFTDTLLPGFRPAPAPFFTAGLFLTPQGDSTLYRAVAVHGDSAARQKHEEMGFHDGWGTVVGQMVDYIKAM